MTASRKRSATPAKRRTAPVSATPKPPLQVEAPPAPPMRVGTAELHTVPRRHARIACMVGDIFFESDRADFVHTNGKGEHLYVDAGSRYFLVTISAPRLANGPARSSVVQLVPELL